MDGWTAAPKVGVAVPSLWARYPRLVLGNFCRPPDLERLIFIPNRFTFHPDRGKLTYLAFRTSAGTMAVEAEVHREVLVRHGMAASVLNEFVRMSWGRMGSRVVGRRR